MESIIFVSIFVVSATFASISDPCILQYGFKIKAYDNRKISQSVMWTMNNLTKAECLAECYKQKYCLSFHFSPLEPACVALRARYDGVSVPTTDASGYQLFQTIKPVSEPGSDCEIDVDCVSLSSSHCHEGICRCDIGYGSDGPICRKLTECDVFGVSFTMFSGRSIRSNNIRDKEASTPQACQQQCRDKNDCESADYNVVRRKCYQQQKTWFDVPVEDRFTTSEYDFCQRDCKTWG